MKMRWLRNGTGYVLFCGSNSTGYWIEREGGIHWWIGRTCKEVNGRISGPYEYNELASVKKIASAWAKDRMAKGELYL